MLRHIKSPSSVATNQRYQMLSGACHTPVGNTMATIKQTGDAGEKCNRHRHSTHPVTFISYPAGFCFSIGADLEVALYQ